MAVSLSLAITQNSQNIANNTSNVTVTATIHWTNGSWNAYAQCHGSITIDGVVHDLPEKIRFNESHTQTGSQVVMTKTVDVTHNGDGTKTLNCSAIFYVYLNTTTSTSGSGSKVLTTIARASQPSLVTWPESTQNVGEFGATFSIHMNRKSDSFTHTVRYEYGSRTGTIASNVGTGTTWAVPLTFISDIPSATSASGRIYVDTYNGSSLVGTKYTGFTVTVPASVKPSCSIALDDITGIDDIYGSPVKGLSKIKVTVSATQAYSSPIDSYSISVNGETFKASTGTTGVLTRSGSVPVNVTVKDKRGRTGTASYTMNVQDYTAPAVTMLTVKRCNQDGTENDQGEYCQLAFNATVSSMNSKNTATYSGAYKPSTSGSWTEQSFPAINNNYSVATAYYTFPADSNASYDVKVTVKDRHNTITRTTSVSTAFTIMNFHESGTGIGVGKVCEHENISEFGVPADFQRPVYGRAYGLSALPQIPENADLNNYITPGCYGVGSNSTTETIANIPLKLAGRLFVASANGGTEGSSYTYLEQRYVPLHYGLPQGDGAWVRFLQKSPGTDWSISSWINEAIKAYPIGSIYISYNHDNPATLFGGSWQRIENRFLWAASASGTMGQTGGASEVTLTVDQIPAHSHGSVYSQHASGTKSQAWYSNSGSSLAYGTVETGGGQAHNNMPPYIQVSMWRRTG